jgi:hypothetical protein
VRGVVDDAVGDAVRGVVGGAVRGVVDGVVGDAVDDNWFKYLGGQWWGYWRSWRDAFRRAGLELPNNLWDRFDAECQASQAGWWWPHTHFVIVADRPSFIHREQVAPQGWGSHQLHNPTGPSIAWGNEWALHHWHGTRVPAWVIEGPTPEMIAAEKNTEIRRCAIESFGWPEYLTALGVQPVSVEADPGNPGHDLTLYDVPDSRRLFGADVRLLVMRNASRDRDGSRRTFGETVPATCATAVDAAAWQFGCAPDIYRQLQRAT